MTFDLDLEVLWVSDGVVTADRVYRSRKANLPTDVNIAILNIVETGGLEPQDTHDGHEYDRPAAQCVARHKSSDIAKLLAYAAWRSCRRVRNRNVNGTQYLNIKPQQSPFELEPDAANRARWAFNVIGWKAG